MTDKEQITNNFAKDINVPSKEQIMIDGVDISKCKKSWCSLKTCSGFKCAKWHILRAAQEKYKYKTIEEQLARKTQEYQKLVDILRATDTYSRVCSECRDDILFYSSISGKTSYIDNEVDRITLSKIINELKYKTQECESLKEELNLLKNNEDLLISKLQVLWGKQIAKEQGDCKNIDYSKPRTKEIYHKITEIERTLKDVAFAQSVNIRKTKPLGDTGSPKSYKRWEARERKLLEREFLK